MKTLKYVLVFVLIIALLAPAGAAWADPGGGGKGGFIGGGGKGGGGGGHTETAGNNLSFPVIMVDGVLLLPGTFGIDKFENPFLEPSGFAPDAEGVWWFPQKTEGNSWQAESSILDGADCLVDEVDWGDSLESVPMKVGRPVRIEASFYKTDLVTPMKAYAMTMLANPSSPDEVQGAGVENWSWSVDDATFLGSPKTSYIPEATIYSPGVKLVIQKILDPVATLSWDETTTQWTSVSADAIGTPIRPIFSSELNVGGKVIYGLSQGGWRPSTVGVYRLTIFLEGGVENNTQLTGNTQIRQSIPEESVNALEDEGEEPSGGTAQIDSLHNLTYIDINVVTGGGGGKPQAAAANFMPELSFVPDEVISVDVKPQACPNVINIDMPGPEGNGNGPGGPGNGSGGNGSEPGGHVRAAVLGSATFDVADILLDSVRMQVPVGEGFEEIMPEANHTVVEDVSTPYATTFAEPLDAYACHVLGADGFEDASFLFETPEIAELLAGTPEGTVVPLTLTGTMVGNRTFAGVDLVLINEGGPAGGADNTLDYTVFTPLVRKSGQ